MKQAFGTNGFICFSQQQKKNLIVCCLRRTRTQHVPVTVVPTVQADKGLWGGEGVLIGYEDGNVTNDY